MERDVHHYDNTDRKGPRIFVGEWATREGNPTPNFNAAMADAAWLTGLERNSDIVVMNSYAPLFINVNRGANQWGTDLIGYNALSSFGSASYYAQKMFNENMGDTVLPVDLAEPPQTRPTTLPAPAGGIGVATFHTEAQFKDIKVTADNQVNYQSDFSKSADGWRPRGGQWDAVDGALTQTSDASDCRMTAGDPAWTDYTYSLKARKISGNEGFLVMFHVRGPNDFIWWNVGGWRNTRSALQKTVDGERTDLGPSAPVTVEDNRWYDVRVELKGTDVKCYLDDKLITEATDVSPAPLPAIYASASRVSATGQVILKVVNVSSTPQALQINLQGTTDVKADARAITLTGQPADVNTLDEPRKIFPTEADFHDAAASFIREIPAYSVSVLKLDAKP
jgi:alpha-L-arabinofuranosidase